MATALAKPGVVYLLDHGRHSPHYFVVLEEPSDDVFWLVSFTDQQNFEANKDVWEEGTRLTETFQLSKNSVLQIVQMERYSQSEIDAKTLSCEGICTPDVLRDIRCNICEMADYIRPPFAGWFEKYRAEWNAEC